MSRVIELNDYDEEGFKLEITKILGSLEVDRVDFKLTDAFAKNSKVFFDLLSKCSNAGVVYFIKDENVSMMSLRIFIKAYLGDFFTNVNHVRFVNFSNDELRRMLGMNNYIVYINRQGLEVEDYVNKDAPKEVLEMTKSYPKLKRFVDLKNDLPMSYFIEANEKGKDRFMFAFYFYTLSVKYKVLETLEKFGAKSELMKLYKKEYNPELIYKACYGLVFDSKTQTLERETIYFEFTYPDYTKQSKHFLKDTFNVHVPENISKINLVGFDFYKDNREVKLYNSSQEFNVKLDDKDLFKVLKKKLCTHVTKIRNREVVDEKFEFQRENFSDKELEVLSKKKLVNKNTKLFTLYVNSKTGKIRKNIKYEY